MDDRTALAKKLLAGGLLVMAGGLIYMRRKEIVIAGEQIADVAKRETFLALIPAAARPYADIILRVADEESVPASLITILGQRESGWGTSSALDQPGPAGRGDGGHGYGLMQIDDRSFADWLRANDWTDPYTNVKKGAQILKAKARFFTGTSTVKGLVEQGLVIVSATHASKRGISPGNYPDPRPLTGTDLVEAAVAAYNTGEGSVLMSLAAGLDPDTTTAASAESRGKGDYSKWVLTRVAAIETGLADAGQA